MDITHISVTLLADLLTLLDPVVIYPEPMPDDFEATQPAYRHGVDIEVGDE